MAKAKDSKSSKKAKGASKSSQNPPEGSSGSAGQGQTVEINHPQVQPQQQQNAEPEKVKPLTTAVMMAKATIILAAGSLLNVALQLALQPLYGSAPLAANYKKISLAGPVLSGFIPEFSKTSKLWNDRFVMSIFAAMIFLAPHLSFWVAAQTGRMGSVSLGPAITLVALFLPTMVMAVVLVKHYLINAMTNPPAVTTIFAPFLCMNIIQGLEPVILEHLPLGDRVNSTTMFLAVGSVLAILAFMTPAPGRERRNGLLILPDFTVQGLILPLLIGVSVFSSMGIKSESRQYPISSSDGTFHLLASRIGKHGLVTVGENSKEKYRYLRAGHSIIGGVWIADKAHTPQNAMNPPSFLSPVPLGDTIYGAFNLQEGVRMFQRPDSMDRAAGAPESALIIGLGAGTAARALNEHNVSLTIIELDPLVYEFARDYFGLHRLQLQVGGLEPVSTSSPPVISTHLHGGQIDEQTEGRDGIIYLEEARQWVQKRAQSLAAGRPVTVGDSRFEKFDYVIHDVFSGGSVPAHLFSLEFWAEAKASLREDGVVAVNFVGRLGSPAAKGVLLTLQKSFSSGECRAYHDDTERKDWEDPNHDHGFFNMVIFCADFKLKPRAGVEADYLGSPLRERLLSKLSEREIPEERILGDLKVASAIALEEEKAKWVIKDSSNRLGFWQTETAMEHWKVMREVMPAQAWELY